ncbi:MAG: hypothetical protein IKA57_04590 [Clostridia bacterium]|nr:hypothetical protein [Clostridia bacterium]
MAKSEKKSNQVDLLGVYEYLRDQLEAAKNTLVTEVRMASAQISSLHGDLKSSSDKATMAVSQEIRFSYKQNQTIYDGLASMLTKEVGERLNSVEAMLTALEKLQLLIDDLNELKYGYMNLQSVCDTTQALVANEVNPKLDSVGMTIANETNPKLDALTNFVCNEINPKLDALEEINNKLAMLPTEDDYNRIVEAVATKADETAQTYSRQVVDAIAALPTAENVDYSRIVEEVGDKVLDLLHQIKGEDPAPVLPVETKIDYDRIICGAAEKVIESLPYPEKVDYSRLENAFTIDQEALAEAVAAKVVIPEASAAPEIDYERLADMVASKIAAPAAPEVDYERLADMVAERMSASANAYAIAAEEETTVDYSDLATMVSDMVIDKMSATTEKACEVMLDEAGIDEIAAKVAGKIAPSEAVIDYDKVCQAAQAAQILPDPVDYDRIAEIVEDKLSAEEPTYDLVIDEEGIEALAKGVSKELCQLCTPCECAPCEEAAVEECVEEAVVESVEEVIEEVVEAPAEEAVVEETAAEEVVEEVVVEETPVEEELAATAGYQEVGDDLIDAETGLVIRLKRSFTAKMKQSDEKVKAYYSDIKNELTSYKKINSNVSWHGDRFNYGRDTVAKINICGKTLCFYLDLDPNDPELKSTVYHQKDVGGQKAYESTPFMVKVKSDAAAKKALRLVGYLADKLGTEKDGDFAPVDYAGEFAYASTKQLFDEGFIKATKEKKVDLNF